MPAKSNDEIPNIQIDDQMRRMITSKLQLENFEGIDNLTKRVCYDKLRKGYPNNNTFEKVLYTISKHYMYINWEGTRLKTLKVPVCKYWFSKAQDITKDIEKDETKQELRNNEIENWKSQKEIKELMIKTKPEISDLTNYNRWLLLNMCTLQAPLRNDFYATCQFITSIKDDNKTDNFVFLNRQKKNVYYIVNNDKVTDKMAKYKSDEYRIIKIVDRQLVKILNDSYDEKNRKYVFQTKFETPYTNSSIYDVLLKREYGLNFDILRSSFITQFYSNHPLLSDREDLAKMMRHEKGIAEQKYNKPLAIANEISIESIMDKLSRDEQHFLLKHALELVKLQSNRLNKLFDNIVSN